MSVEPKPSASPMLSLIRRAADDAHVPRSIALAFAWLESTFDPAREGDLRWHEKREGELYRLHVLQGPRFARNPWRTQAALWHSYGLFQLLAPYHCDDDADPRSLLDPTTNARKGCALLRSLHLRSHGDVRAMRLAYVGCGLDGQRCAEAVTRDVLTRLDAALARFSSEGA